MNPSAHSVVRTNGTEARQAGWWKAIFEQAEEILLVCDATGAILAANSRARRLLPPDPVPTLSELLTRQNELKVLDWLRRPEAAPTVLSSVMIVAGGHLCMLADLHLTPLGNAQGQVAIKDASRRWRVESHVQRLAAAIDATPDVFFLTDAELRLTFVNAAFQQVTGHDIEESLGKQADFLRAPGQEAVQAEYLRQVRAGKDWTGELQNRRKDGTLYPVAATISPVFGQEGDFLGYVSNEREIYAWKKMQAQLLEEQALLRGVLDANDAAIYILDQDFRIIKTNEGWKQMPAAHGWLLLNRPPEPGKSLLDYAATPERRDDLKVLLDQTLHAGKRQDRKHSTARTSESIRVDPWFHGGTVAGLIYQVADQTARQDLAAQWLQSLNLVMRHDLAADGVQSLSRQLEVLTAAQDQAAAQTANQAADLARQLASFCRPNEGCPLVLDLKEIVRKVTRLCSAIIPSNLELACRTSDEPVLVFLDPVRAELIFLSLCANALETMPAGGKLTMEVQTVRLTPKQKANMKGGAGDRAAQCVITDTGHKIPSDAIARLAEPFSALPCLAENSGLGLAFAHQLVETAGGFIEAEATPDTGTVLRIYLPLTAPAESGPAKTSGQATAHHLIVVEDMEVVRTFTCDFLRAAGVDVVPAESAREALEILQKDSRFDLIMTDYNMPEMNGIELIKLAGKRHPKLRFILCSGFLDEEEEERLKHIPRVSILTKPYTLKDVLAAIAEVTAQP